MPIAHYFVEFIFFSFLGWIWESVYCTVVEKHWQDRGFLFGPVCPIYGGCVVAASLVFGGLARLSPGPAPLWQIFIICAAGSAVAEYATSWVLERRFHARWWDYSRLPLNLKGRICLPATLGFGLAGIAVVRYLLPWTSGLHGAISPMVYEGLAIGFALLFGADVALTEASLSALIDDVARIHREWNARAQATYESVSHVPERLENAGIETREAIEARMRSGEARLREMVEHSAARLSWAQRRTLSRIHSFKPRRPELALGEKLREAMRRGQRAAAESKERR
jgi:uncharacterized membrane protein